MRIYKEHLMKKDCQSCGMPLSKDSQGGGSEADGSKSSLYCSHCYKSGSFIEPLITCEQMVEKVKVILKQMGIPSLLGWFFTRKIPRLLRWKQDACCRVKRDV